MSDQEYEIGSTLKWDSDNAKLDQVIEQLEKINTSLSDSASKQHEAADASKEHEGALDGLQQKVIGLIADFVSFGAAVKGLMDSFKSAVSAEEELYRLDNTAKRFGGTVETQLPALHDWLDQLTRISGLTKDEVIPGMDKLIIALGSTGKAQEAVELASTLAARGLGTFEENMATLTRTIMTGHVPMRSMSALADMLRKGGDDLGGTIDRLHREFHDMGASVHTTGIEMRRNAEAWTETKEKIGDVYMALSSNLRPAFEFIAGVISKIVSGLTMLAGVFVASKQAMSDWATAAKLVLTGHFKEATEIGNTAAVKWTSTVQAFVDRAQKMEKEVATVWANVGKDAAKAADETMKGMKFGPQKPEEPQGLPKAKKIDAQWRDPLTGLTLAESQAMFDKYDGIVLKSEQTTQGKIDAIRKRASDKFKSMTEDELNTKIEQLQELLNNEEATDEQIAQIRKLLAELSTQLNQDFVEKQIDQALGAFGANRDIAAAEGVYHTISSSIKAFDQFGGYPTGIPALLLSLVTGFAKVAEIESTTPKSKHGSASVTSGGSGMTYPSVYSGGAERQSAPSSVSTTNVNTNAPSQTTINVNALDTNDALRTIQTKWRPASRGYDRSIGNRSSTQIGSKRGG